MQRIILDTDIGGDIDDALTLAMVKGLSDLELLAVTTVYGPVEKRALLAARLLRSMGDRTTPVAAGLSVPDEDPVNPDPIEAQFLAIVGDEPAPPYTHTPAVNLMRSVVLAHPDEITIVPIGPLTNIAAFIRRYPDDAARVKEIVMMGGAFTDRTPECNIRCDVAAADVVFSSGLPIRAIPFDLTRHACMPLEQLERLYREKRPGQYMLARLVHLWQGGYGFGCNPYLHDPLALGCLVAPELYTFEPMDVEVRRTPGSERGVTIGRPNPDSRTRVATAVDYDGFFNLFGQAIFADFPEPVTAE